MNYELQKSRHRRKRETDQTATSLQAQKKGSTVQQEQAGSCQAEYHYFAPFQKSSLADNSPLSCWTYDVEVRICIHMHTLLALVASQLYVKPSVQQQHARTDARMSFLSGMNPMISSRNCTLQQSSVNCRDQCVHRECHCKMCR